MWLNTGCKNAVFNIYCEISCLKVQIHKVYRYIFFQIPITVKLLTEDPLYLTYNSSVYFPVFTVCKTREEGVLDF
jgi:hypothetical protein